jgi:hypothetical protein
MNAQVQDVVVHEQPGTPASESDPFLVVARLAASHPMIDADKLVKLYDLADRANKARASVAFADAFATMIHELPSIDRRGRIIVYSKEARERGVKESDRPQQDTPYATFDDILENIIPVLAKHRFSIRFEHETVTAGDSYRIKTKAILRHKDGHYETAETPPLPHDSTGSKNPTQAVGSAMAYGKRYALRAVLPIVSHAPQDADDDAKKANEPEAIGVDEIAFIEQQIRDTGSDLTIFLKLLGAESVAAIPASKYRRALELLEAKKRKQAAGK